MRFCVLKNNLWRCGAGAWQADGLARQAVRTTRGAARGVCQMGNAPAPETFRQATLSLEKYLICPRPMA